MIKNINSEHKRTSQLDKGHLEQHRVCHSAVGQVSGLRTRGAGHWSSLVVMFLANKTQVRALKQESQGVGSPKVTLVHLSSTG